MNMERNEHLRSARGDIESDVGAGMGLVVDAQGNPLRVFRGEHGAETGPLQCRLGSISFGSLEAARCYASTPNNSRDSPIAPRIIEAHLTIRRPVINQPNDPFMEMSDIIQAVGVEKATRIALGLAEYIEDTDHWGRTYADDFTGVRDLLSQRPDALSDLYLLAYRVLDQSEYVSWFSDAGFDGAIHAGSAVTACEAEYKVFSPDQVTILDVNPVDHYTQPNKRIRPWRMV